jgi:glycosyltransferase involved in cell wall biosynthesis
MQRTGTENYARRLIQALLDQAPPAHRLRLYFRDAPAPGTWAGGEQRIIPFSRLWTHVRLSWELATQPRPDVLFVPAHVLPWLHPLPSVVTLHDLGYRHFPDAHPLAQLWYLDWSTRFSARAATRLIADSLCTRADLTRFYHIPTDKVTVIYPGRDESLRRVDPAPVRAKYNLPEHYILHVGTLQPRKNLIRLLEAAQSAFSLQPSAFSLVLAGRPGWLSTPIIAKAREHRNGVRLLDYVADEDLAGLYSGALAFVFPSLYEGFGFPVLEAMACGAPVICSNTSSLPEVAGEAALLIDPTDTPALVAALRRVIAEPGLRAALVARGYEQAKRFSWAKAAGETLAVLEEAARR